MRAFVLISLALVAIVHCDNVVPWQAKWPSYCSSTNTTPPPNVNFACFVSSDGPVDRVLPHSGDSIIDYNPSHQNEFVVILETSDSTAKFETSTASIDVAAAEGFRPNCIDFTIGKKGGDQGVSTKKCPQDGIVQIEPQS